MKLRDLLKSHTFDPKLTLNRAREWWHEVILGKGGKCPCCGRYGKIYKYVLNRTIARAVLWLHYYQVINNVKWVYLAHDGPNWVNSTISKCYSMGLVNRSIESEPDLGTGYWKLSELGLEFINGKKILKQIYKYDDTVIELDNNLEVINIYEALENEGFDYDEVMKPIKG